MADTARTLLPSLVEADARVASLPPVPHWSATNEEYAAWAAQRDAAAAAVAAALAAHRDLICRKCDGRGRVQWRHRSGGLCYQCNGDGWTANGRRQHAKA